MVTLVYEHPGFQLRHAHQGNQLALRDAVGPALIEKGVAPDDRPVVSHIRELDIDVGGALIGNQSGGAGFEASGAVTVATWEGNIDLTDGAICDRRQIHQIGFGLTGRAAGGEGEGEKNGTASGGSAEEAPRRFEVFHNYVPVVIVKRLQNPDLRLLFVSPRNMKMTMARGRKASAITRRKV